MTTDRRRMAGLARAASALVAALVLVGCGIPISSPEALPQEGREDLLQGTTTTTTVVGAAETTEIRLFFIGPDDKLETIQRPFTAPASINTVLKALEQAPQPEEQVAPDEVGLLRSLVPANLDATLLQEDPEDAALGVRTLQVASGESQLRQILQEAESPAQASLIASQVVCTFLRVAPDGTNGVQIIDDQGQIQLTDNAAQPITSPATEADFGDCQTGTEERNALVEAGAESTSTSAEDGSNSGG